MDENAVNVENICSGILILRLVVPTMEESIKKIKKLLGKMDLE